MLYEDAELCKLMLVNDANDNMVDWAHTYPHLCVRNKMSIIELR